MKVSRGEENGRDYVNELQVNIEKCVFKWELNGFKQVPYLIDHPVFSPSFILGTCSESVWQMLMAKELRSKKDKLSKEKESEGKTDVEFTEAEADAAPTSVKPDTESGEADMESKDMEVDASPSSDPEMKSEERVLGFKLIKTEEGSTWDVITYRVEFSAGDVKKTTMERTETGSPYGSTTDFLYIYEKDLDGLDFDNVETVHLQVFIEYIYIDLNPLVPPRVEDGDKFTEDLCRLFKTERYSDVVLIAGEAEIPAHKGILCARAYGFDCHLQEDPEFVKQKVLLDVDECVARALLAYIYCGGLPVEFPLEKCKALCAAADKYQVNGLKPVVTDFFKKNLDPATCMQCLSLEDKELGSIDLSEDQIRSILQKDTCSHRSKQEE